MTAHLTDALERAEQFDADLWREVAGLIRNKTSRVRWIAILGLVEQAAVLNDSKMPDLSNHLMLAVAAALVPERALWSVCDMEEGPHAQVIRPMPGGGYVNGLTSSSAHIPANALASAAIKARAPEAGK